MNRLTDRLRCLMCSDLFLFVSHAKDLVMDKRDYSHSSFENIGFHWNCITGKQLWFNFMKIYVRKKKENKLLLWVKFENVTFIGCFYLLCFTAQVAHLFYKMMK